MGEPVEPPDPTEVPELPEGGTTPGTIGKKNSGSKKPAAGSVGKI